MPFAQHHYPFAEKQKPKSKSRMLPYPADYICEAIDQTRGWFYTLLAVSTLLGRGSSYKNVISLGHVLDQNGQKMSKSKGNIVEPLSMIAKYGADAIRWYFYTVNAPGDPKHFDQKDVALRLRGALSTLWNSFVFFDTYVDKVKGQRFKVKGTNVLDRWVTAKLDELTAEVTGRLDRYDIVSAARALDQFIVEDFSNWYIRRSRRRLQHPTSQGDYAAATLTMGHGLLRLTELMAPFTPFLAESVYQELKRKLGLREESVHVRDWPRATKRTPSDLLKAMSEARRLAALALAMRAKAGIKVRQPLARLKVKRQRVKDRVLLTVLAEEVNVKEAVVDPKIKGEVELDTTITPELREEGMVRELIRNVQELRRQAGLRPQQGVRCQVSGVRVVEEVIERWRRFIQQEANATAIQIGGKKQCTVEREVRLDGHTLWLGIRRV
jgi:isoleucyl-tRNA synthetase